MTRRLVATATNEAHGAALREADVYRDSDWQEYVVRLILAGRPYRPADFHTGDLADAIQTAERMVEPGGMAATLQAFTGPARQVLTQATGARA